MKSLELLAPAGNAGIAFEAIRHGADAVYIGPPSHGARKSAANSIEDIKRVVDFAHIFNAKVYVTLNTIIFESELKAVEKMIRRLYTAGVDALIVQDMGILRMDIPPIQLHASTQCDIRTPEKALFLQEAGFSQLVLARELSVDEIREICKAVTIPVETFVHGALCVSYSGKCGAGYAAAGRSGNRGECPQICRHSFTLTDADGRILAKDRYLLSLKDFRADSRLEQLIEAGVSSFKIEGRMKEADYVKNITAYYSNRLDSIIGNNPDLRRSSYGNVKITFTPNPEKSFNRGFTDYRLSGKPDPAGIASMLTPKSLGEPVRRISDLRPGDGISYFDRRGNFDGMLVNGIRDGKIIGNRPFNLPAGTEIRRTSSIEWKKLMASESSSRKLGVDITLDAKGITAADETGARVTLSHSIPTEPARRQTDYRDIFEKLGNTPFELRNFTNSASSLFFPASYLTRQRRLVIEKLEGAKRATYRFEYRGRENRDYPYPLSSVDYGENVANSLARQFYTDHGVKSIEPALETADREKAIGKRIMTSRHCILRELGLCLKTKPGIRLPLLLKSGNLRMQPEFDCSRCEMHLTRLP